MSAQATISQEESKETAALDELKFIKVLIPENVRLIPKKLIESVKGNYYTPEQFFKYQEQQIKDENPYNLLFILINKSKQIEGYLWCELSQFDNSLFVNTFSISKEYWFKGKSIPKVIEFLNELKSKFNSPRVFWITVNPKFFEKNGFKRSKNVLMEYNDE